MFLGWGMAFFMPQLAGVIADQTGSLDNALPDSELRVSAGGACGQPTCWRSTSRGFKYAAGAGLDPGGLLLLKLDAGADGQARITLKASGARLGMPALPLAQSDTVTAQLSNDGGVCWEGVYGAPARISDAGRFKDLSD